MYAPKPSLVFSVIVRFPCSNTSSVKVSIEKFHLKSVSGSSIFVYSICLLFFAALKENNYIYYIYMFNGLLRLN